MATKTSDGTAWTAGPWHVGVKPADVIVYDAKGWAIANATVYHGKSDREKCKANARLIAAAPELADLAVDTTSALAMLDVVIRKGSSALDREEALTFSHATLAKARTLLARIRGEGE